MSKGFVGGEIGDYLTKTGLREEDYRWKTPLGGTQTVRLLGPYRVTYEDLTPYTDQGFLVSDGAELATGSIILNAWAEKITPFNQNSMTTMSLGILTLDPADQESYVFPKSYDILDGQESNTFVGVEITQPLHQTVLLPMRITGNAREIRVSLYTEGGTLTVGAVDVFVLVAQPA